MCQVIRRQYPDLDLITGGGVRSREDLQRFSLLGVNSVLVASLLHDGNLGREEVHGW
jgi:phosphoribosylformimino-5-aminoimidazole carboxamide ribotide isomerase